jgi:hypothetical protein
MDHRIARARPRRNGIVEVEWTNGTKSTIDFKPWIAKGGIFTPLAEPSFFVGMMHVHWDGYSLGWPGEIDFSAEGLWPASQNRTAKPARKGRRVGSTRVHERRRVRAA